MIKLQIAFDITDLDKALTIAKSVAPYCDIIEIGSLLIYKYGIESIKQFRIAAPGKTLLADIKAADRGKDTTTLLCNAGADWVTVLAGTSKEVIQGATTTAQSLHKKIMLDLIDAPSAGQSAMEAEELGIQALLFHRPFDNDGALVITDQWEMVRGNTKLPIFVSAKIDRESIKQVFALQPNGIVISDAIVNANNPKEEAQYFYQLCQQS